MDFVEKLNMIDKNMYEEEHSLIESDFTKFLARISSTIIEAERSVHWINQY